jgi:hypothetical protein
VQLVTEGEVLQFQNSPTTEAAGNTRDDGTHELKHAGDTAATLQKTLEFSMPSEFSVGTGYMRNPIEQVLSTAAVRPSW